MSGHRAAHFRIWADGPGELRRSEGIDERNPVGAEARRWWRRALKWMGRRSNDADQLDPKDPGPKDSSAPASVPHAYRPTTDEIERSLF